MGKSCHCLLPGRLQVVECQELRSRETELGAVGCGRADGTVLHELEPSRLHGIADRGRLLPDWAFVDQPLIVCCLLMRLAR